jgi:hypothetical protein
LVEGKRDGRRGVLHDYTVASLCGWGVWVFALAYGTPDAWHQVVLCRFAVTNQTVKDVKRNINQ